jgi:hypothetical protein
MPELVTPRDQYLSPETGSTAPGRKLQVDPEEEEPTGTLLDHAVKVRARGLSSIRTEGQFMEHCQPTRETSHEGQHMRSYCIKPFGRLQTSTGLPQSPV